MEILEVSGEAVCRLSSMLGQMSVVLAQSNLRPDSKVLNSSLGELYQEAQRLQLRSLSKHMARVKDHLLSGSATTASLKPMVDELYNRMRDDLQDRLMIAIDPNCVDLYRQKEPLFGSDVEQKFAQMSEDIAESGKCLAFNRATAAVFHLMRLMEIAVQKFGDKLGVTLTSEKNWQTILDQINKAIKGMDHHQAITKKYAEISANLYAVKVGWRNEVMHPKQTYTLEEANYIFMAVRIFIRDLATVL